MTNKHDEYSALSISARLLFSQLLLKDKPQLTR